MDQVYNDERPHPEDFGQPSRSELAEDEKIDERNAKIRAATSDAEVRRIVREYRERYGI